MTEVSYIARPCNSFESATKRMECVGGKLIQPYPLFVFPVHDWPHIWNWGLQGVSIPVMSYRVKKMKDQRLAAERLRQLEEYTQLAERRCGKVGQ